LERISLPPAESAEVIGSIVAEILEKPFAYYSAPLFRAVLVSLDAARHLLVVGLHHLVADRWSLRILRRDLQSFYDDGVTMQIGRPVSELRIQYGDFADWQQRRFSLMSSEAETYWRDVWSRFGSALVQARHLPFASVSSARQESLGYEAALVAPEVVSAVKSAVAGRGMTLYMLCLAAVGVVLYAHTHRSVLAIWGYCANRVCPGTEDLIGWFVNGRILGLVVSPGMTVNAFLEQVRRSVYDACLHQELPVQLLTRVVEEQGRLDGVMRDDFVSLDVVIRRPPADAVTFGGGATARSAA
jgi:hypothetical protein